MTRILHASLGAEDAGSSSWIAALGVPAERLAVSPMEASIPKLRSAVEAAPGPASAFILAVESGGSGNDASETDWERQVLVPLRQAFGLLTGAARRFRRDGSGAIVVIMPSVAIGSADIDTPQLVLLRSIVGMAEALRAELQGGKTRVSLLFRDRLGVNTNTLAKCLTALLASGAMYRLSDDITAEGIHAYFAPLLNAIDRTSAGPPLPDIGPMGAVYDLAAAGAPVS